MTVGGKEVEFQWDRLFNQVYPDNADNLRTMGAVVTYSHGRENPPDDVYQASLTYIATLWEQYRGMPESGRNVVNERIGDYQVQYELTTRDRNARQALRQAIGQYRRVTV